ncbi:MAG: glucose-6-phosphate isomerase [Firmicutes bacterium]|nr:glucose-6-phosphate isomerase [Bacillota bacterium]
MDGSGSSSLALEDEKTVSRVSLDTAAGFPLTLDEHTGHLEFPQGVSVGSVSARRLEEMRPVLADPAADGPEEWYVMYRDVGSADVRRRAGAWRLRYDLTVVRPGVAGRERIKTAGHDHPLKAGTGVTYPEIYQVICGRALYLLQESSPAASGEAGRPREVVLVEAGPGDVVVIPPGYGHVTVNAGDGWLVMCNWVSDGFESLYGPMRAARGAAVYVLDDGLGGWMLSPNPRYGAVAVRCLRAGALPGLDSGAVPVYRALMDSPERFAFLSYPERAGEMFARVQAAWRAVAPVVVTA